VPCGGGDRSPPRAGCALRQGESPESQGDARTVGVWDTPKSGLGVEEVYWVVRGGLVVAARTGVGFKNGNIYTT